MCIPAPHGFLLAPPMIIIYVNDQEIIMKINVKIMSFRGIRGIQLYVKIHSCKRFCEK